MPTNSENTSATLAADPRVPFGKYKGGQASVLQADTNYVAWFEMQPWFVAIALVVKSFHASAVTLVVTKTLDSEFTAAVIGGRHAR